MPTYLTSEKGFKNWCKGCPELERHEKTGFLNITERVICKTEKCTKEAKT
jgi:hypothetical protein